MCKCCEEGMYVYLEFDACETCEYAIKDETGTVTECKNGLMGKDCPEWCDDVKKNVS